VTEMREVFRHLRILRHTLNIVIPVFFCAMGMMHAQNNARARDLGIPFDGTTGPLNAITDIRAVEVGHTTLISGD